MRGERVFRIGDKLVSLEKAMRQVERALEMRERGVSQQETAKRLQLDRSFISRLETVGEIRKGNRVAVVGFPIANKDELSAICRDKGLEFYLLLNNQERWELVKDKQAMDFFNRMTDLVTRLRAFDTLVMLTSNKWFHLAEALLDLQIIYIELGPTPIEEDRIVDRELFEMTLEQVLSGSVEGSTK